MGDGGEDTIAFLKTYLRIQERARGPFSKLERAKKQIEELTAAIKAFHDTRPYELGAEVDPHTREPVYRLVSIRIVPSIIPAIVGDVLNNLRGALDHLAFHLVAIHERRIEPTETQFPAFNSSEEYSAGIDRIVKRMPYGMREIFDSMQPYQRGNGHLLWVIRKLNNRDKHRLLISTPSHVRGRSPTPSERELIARDHPEFTVGPTTILPIPGVARKPLEAGQELFRGPANSEPDQHITFHVDVAIHEPNIVTGVPVVELLQGCVQFVERCVLKPLALYLAIPGDTVGGDDLTRG